MFFSECKRARLIVSRSLFVIVVAGISSSSCIFGELGKSKYHGPPRHCFLLEDGSEAWVEQGPDCSQEDIAFLGKVYAVNVGCGYPREPLLSCVDLVNKYCKKKNGNCTIEKELKKEGSVISIGSNENRSVRIILDGEYVGNSPIRWKEVRPGKHVLRMESPCYLSEEIEIELAPGEHFKEWYSYMKPRLGSLRLNVVDEESQKVPEYEMFIDGFLIENRISEFQLPICTKEILVMADGYEKNVQTLIVEEGKETILNVELKKSLYANSKAETEIIGKIGEVWRYSKPASLYFKKTEVTADQFQQCVEDGACDLRKVHSSNDRPDCNLGSPDRTDHPMNCMNYESAKEVCEWFGGRLPTYQEIKLEASNSGKWIWPWGNHPKVNCEHVVWTGEWKKEGCGKGRTWPVCSKELGNSLSGLCDLSGNVMEWTDTRRSEIESTGDGEYIIGFSERRSVWGGGWFSSVESDFGNKGNELVDEHEKNKLSTLGVRCVKDVTTVQNSFSADIGGSETL